MAIILASQSPRRKELLGQIVEDFSIEPADIDETIHEKDQPQEYVHRMAKNKAAVVSEHHPEDLVIACDTIVVADGKILGKPKNSAEAFAMLKRLSGRMHHVYTGVVLRKDKQIESAIVPAKVLFFDLTDEEIKKYLETGEYSDKAGAYGIQGKAGVFVKKIDGDYYSIVGFPTGVVYQMLKKFTPVSN